MVPHRSQWIFAACLALFHTSATAQSAASTSLPAAITDSTSPPTDSNKGENVFYIRSSGLIAASLNGGGSAMSERLALLLLQARDHSTQITVAGGNEQKTLRVVKYAFD